MENPIITLIKNKYKEGDQIVIHKRDFKYPLFCSLALVGDNEIVVTTKKNAIFRVSANDIIDISPVSTEKSERPIESIISKSMKDAIVKKVSAPSKPEKQVQNSYASESSPLVNLKKQIKPMGQIIGVEDAMVVIKVKDQTVKVKREKIIDKKVIKELNNSQESTLSIPVIWGELNNEIVCVAGRMSLEQLNSRVNTYKTTENYRIALALALLLDQYVSDKSKRKCLEFLKTQVTGTHLPPEPAGDLYYTKGNTEKKLNNNIPLAIEYYLESIKQNEKIKTMSLRAVIDCYIEHDEEKNAIDLIDKYELDKPGKEIFPHTKQNLIWLASKFRTLGLPSRAIDVCNEILKLKDLNKTIRANTYYLLANCMLLMEDSDMQEQAEAYLNKALADNPNDSYVIAKLAELKGEDFFADSTYFNNLRNSQYTADILKIEDASDYITKNTVIDSNLLHELETSLKYLRLSSYEERSQLLLSRARILEVMGPDKYHKKIMSTISQYFVAKALNGYKKKNLPIETIRFLLTESISIISNLGLRQPWRDIRASMAVYLSLFSSATKNTFLPNLRMDRTLDSELFTNAEFWPNVAPIMQYDIPFHILLKYFYNSNYQTSAIEFLQKKGYDIDFSSTLDDFKDTWKTFIRELRNQQDDYEERFKNMQNANFEVLSRNFNDFYLLKDKYVDLLSNLDYARIENLNNLINQYLRPYYQSDSPSEKEFRYNSSITELSRMKKEMLESPTRFSYDCMVTLLEFIENALLLNYEELIERTQPIVDISLVGDTIINDENEIDFQVAISNEKDCSPIRNISVKIKESDMVLEHISGMETNYDSLNGGNNFIIRQRIAVSEETIAKGALSIEVECHYLSLDRNASACVMTKCLSLQLFRQQQQIPNPYQQFSEQAQVTDRAMFFGRDEFIQRISDSLLTSPTPKQYIIYGQRRSGKSSVLYYLREEMEKQGAFCVLFSLEEIADQLTDNKSYVFYADIIYNITIALQSCTAAIKPSFKYDTSLDGDDIFTDYEKSPVVTNKFIADIKELHKSFKETPGWENKRLVIMIDEFTFLYTCIKQNKISDTIMKQWKAITQNENVHFSVVLIGQDTVPSFKNESYAENAFGVISDIRMSYLPEEGARELIDIPIRDNGVSRYVNKAIDKIIDYTACSPYYIQIFCDLLVDYMNDKHINKVTEVDVTDVAMLSLKTKFTENHFHNLFTANDETHESKAKTKELLMIIAKGCTNDDFYPYDSIKKDAENYEWKEELDTLLLDLYTREVITRKDNKYSIKVKLFQLWLLQN